VMYYLKPNNHAPQLGDDDDGRLLVFCKRNLLDHSYLLVLAALLFKKREYKLKRIDFAEEGLWFFGPAAYEEYKKLSDRKQELCSMAFEKGGFYVMRKDQAYIIVSNCGNGQAGLGGHNHNDNLSFELNIRGKDVIIDPGTYIYTGDYELRNLFRNTAFHNTIRIDDKEICGFDTRKIFQRKDEAEPKLINWQTSGEYDVLEASHYGYLKLDHPVVHRRLFRFDKKRNIVEIEDFLEGGGSHKVEIFFHFPAVPVVVHNKDEMCFKIRISREESVLLTPKVKGDLKVSLRKGLISPSYGVKVSAPYVCYYTTLKLPAHFHFMISPQKELIKEEARAV